MSYIGLTWTSKTSIWSYFWLGLPYKSLLMSATLFQHLRTVSLQQYLCQKHHSLSRDQEGKHTAVLTCTKRDMELVLQSANRIFPFKHTSNIRLSSNVFAFTLLGIWWLLFVDKISHQSPHIQLYKLKCYVKKTTSNSWYGQQLGNFWQLLNILLHRPGSIYTYGDISVVRYMITKTKLFWNKYFILHLNPLQKLHFRLKINTKVCNCSFHKV